MSRRPASELFAIVYGDEDQVAPGSLPPCVGRVLYADRYAARGALMRETLDASTLWVHPWTRFTPALVAAIDEWLATPGDAGRPRVATARPILIAGEVRIHLPRAPVLASPGAVHLAAGRPRANPGVVCHPLGTAWELAAPSSLSAHLRAVNAQSSTIARLCWAEAEQTNWWKLAVQPLGFALARFLASSGSRRLALPRVVLEAYREILIAAKLWELQSNALSPTAVA